MTVPELKDTVSASWRLVEAAWVVRTAERVAVYNLAGTVALEGGGSAVVVEVKRQGGDAGRLRIEQGTIRGRESLRVIYPSDRVTFTGMSGSSEVRVRDDGTFFDGESSGGRRVRISDAGGGGALGGP